MTSVLPKSSSSNIVLENTSRTTPRVEIRIEIITPQKAKAWLDNTPEQFRKLKYDRAKRIADHILQGRWECNGETIKLTPEGRVSDGQHRLQGCVIANKSIQSAVAYNVIETLHVDTGKHRSAAEHLRFAGYSNCTTLAAVAKFQWLYERENMTLSGDRSVASPQEILDIVNRCDGLLDSIKISNRCGSICNATPLAFAHYQFSLRDRNLANQFIDSLATGENLGERDPVLILRDLLLKNSRKAQKFSSLYKLALVVKAWNAWREEREVSNLSWRRVGPAPQDFPEII